MAKPVTITAQKAVNSNKVVFTDPDLTEEKVKCILMLCILPQEESESECFNGREISS